MDPLPPNDPNNNSNGNDEARGKEAPHDGRQNGRGGGGSGQELNENGEMDVIGDLRDQGFVMVLFLMGVASYLLREQCTC